MGTGALERGEQVLTELHSPVQCDHSLVQLLPEKPGVSEAVPAR